MDPIGRKMYIDFGNYVVALERLVAVHPSLLGLNRENPTELYNIYDIMGEHIERKVEGECIKRYGCDVNMYMASPELWITKEESERIYKIHCH